jgi:hypothetical protein
VNGTRQENTTWGNFAARAEHLECQPSRHCTTWHSNGARNYSLLADGCGSGRGAERGARAAGGRRRGGGRGGEGEEGGKAGGSPCQGLSREGREQEQASQASVRQAKFDEM